MIYFDAIISGGAVLGFAKADHWAFSLALTQSIFGFAADQNDFPRGVLLEAIARHVDTDLSN